MGRTRQLFYDERRKLAYSKFNEFCKEAEELDLVELISSCMDLMIPDNYDDYHIETEIEGWAYHEVLSKRLMEQFGKEFKPRFEKPYWVEWIEKEKEKL